jgi:predicted alpha/beta hydrolase family esterase
MKNALILHGTKDNSHENWFPWLHHELEKLGWKVWTPNLPGADFPNIKKYNKFLLEENTWNFNSESILIGHSSGAVEILGLLQALPKTVQVDACYLVGSFTGDITDSGDWEMLKGLFEEPFDFEYIKKRAKQFIFIHSDDDPYCPLSQAQELAEKMNGKLIIKSGQKHFSVGTAGEQYREFPFLLELIKENP